jgi:hypothetical protein
MRVMSNWAAVCQRINDFDTLTGEQRGELISVLESGSPFTVVDLNAFVLAGTKLVAGDTVPSEDRNHLMAWFMNPDALEGIP